MSVTILQQLLSHYFTTPQPALLMVRNAVIQQHLVWMLVPRNRHIHSSKISPINRGSISVNKLHIIHQAVALVLQHKWKPQLSK